jgi:predicted dehydrogenase/nucleoside-diphosphate-sugar epimerase
MVESSKSLRVAIVGCGRVSDQHVYAIQALKCARIVGVADINRSNADRLAKLAGVDNVQVSLEDLINSTPLDVIHVVTPPVYHYEYARTILDHGIAAFVEKPFVFSVSELDDLYQRAAAHNVMLCPDYTQLFHPHMERAIEIVESGQMGKVVHVESHMYLDPADLQGPEVQEARGIHWSYGLPGGVLHNFISHPLSLVLRFAGSLEGVKVDSTSRGTLPQGLVDHLAIQTRGSRCTTSVTVSLASKPGRMDVRVFCERGSIYVDFDSQSLLVEGLRPLPRAVNRGIANFAVAYELTKQATGNILRFVFGKLVPYAGLRVITARLYESILTSAPAPITPELARSVVQGEETVFRQVGKVHLDVATRPSQQVETPQTERVLVTGAGGYLGRQVVKELMAAGYHVRALVRPLSRIESLESLGVEIVFGDIRSLEDLRRAAEDVDVIVHAAAAVRGRQQFMVDAAVQGTKNIAEVASALNVRRVVYLSSMSVYDFAKLKYGELITENSPLEDQPQLRGSYTLAKRQAEDVALAHLNDTSPAWTIVRPGVIVGGGRDPAAAVGYRMGNTVICCSSRGKKLRLIHVEDVAAAILSILENEDTKRQVYTLSNRPICLSDYVKTYLRGEGSSKSRVIYVPYFVTWTGTRLVNLLNRLRGKESRISGRQLRYLYLSVGANSDRLTAKTGWQPRHEKQTESSRLRSMQPSE